MSQPLLIVGDVQGDHERLRGALAAYPEDEVETIFLGDFFQGGRLGEGGGAKAATIARGRRNSRAVLGNHDLFLLAMLEYKRAGPSARVPWGNKEGPAFEQTWLSRRGDWADLDTVAADRDLEQWLRSLPLLIRLDDGSLVQHSDTDAYAKIGSSVDEVNDTARRWLQRRYGVFEGLRHVIERHRFGERERVEAYLRHFGARRVVHGHSPHWDQGPQVTHDGLVWCFDGRFSRYWQRDDDQAAGPVGATVALLPALTSAGTA